VFGGTIIERKYNYMLCCVNVVDCDWRYNNAGICNDIL